MKHIKDLLSKNIRASGLSKNILYSQVIEEFNLIIKGLFDNQQIVKKIKPLYIKQKELHVACLSTIVVQEINFHKEDIIDKLNKKFKQKIITNIKFIL